MTVLAAGVVVWREVKGKPEFLLVSRVKYRDWSFAKGKLDPGELLPEAAVREVHEETGMKIRLGRKLGVISYPLPDGDTKEVHYWAAKVNPKTQSELHTEPNEEIQDLRWVDAKAAKDLLSYDHDRSLLKLAIDLLSDAELETRALMVLRHAQALPRSDWKGADGERPLTDSGKQQAKRLTSLLAAFGPKRIVSSPWERCQKTVRPYAKSRHKPIIERGQLSEKGNAKGPKRTKNLVEDLLNGTKTAVVCTHRPALPSVLDALAAHAAPALEIELHEGRTLSPADLLVARLSVAGKLRVVAVERYSLSEVQTN
jgi:8-oxo-dGTP diphosphatase